MPKVEQKFQKKSSISQQIAQRNPPTSSNRKLSNGNNENYFLFQKTNRKKPPRPGNNLYLEKKDLKLTKNGLFGYGKLTTCRKSLFQPGILKISETKNILWKTTLEIACNNVLILYPRRLWWTPLIIELLTKSTFFPYVYFCMIIMMKMAKKDILVAHFRNNWSRVTNRRAESSIEITCQSKKWLQRMERRGNFLIFFQKPGFASEYG